MRHGGNASAGRQPRRSPLSRPLAWPRCGLGGGRAASRAWRGCCSACCGLPGGMCAACGATGCATRPPGARREASDAAGPWARAHLPLAPPGGHVDVAAARAGHGLRCVGCAAGRGASQVRVGGGAAAAVAELGVLLDAGRPGAAPQPGGGSQGQAAACRLDSEAEAGAQGSLLALQLAPRQKQLAQRADRALPLREAAHGAQLYAPAGGVALVEPLHTDAIGRLLPARKGLKGAGKGRYVSHRHSGQPRLGKQGREAAPCGMMVGGISNWAAACRAVRSAHGATQDPFRLTLGFRTTASQENGGGADSGGAAAAAASSLGGNSRWLYAQLPVSILLVAGMHYV